MTVKTVTQEELAEVARRFIRPVAEDLTSEVQGLRRDVSQALMQVSAASVDARKDTAERKADKTETAAQVSRMREIDREHAKWMQDAQKTMDRMEGRVRACEERQGFIETTIRRLQNSHQAILKHLEKQENTDGK